MSEFKPYYDFSAKHKICTEKSLYTKKRFEPNNGGSFVKDYLKIFDRPYLDLPLSFSSRGKFLKGAIYVRIETKNPKSASLNIGRTKVTLEKQWKGGVSRKFTTQLMNLGFKSCTWKGLNLGFEVKFLDVDFDLKKLNVDSVFKLKLSISGNMNQWFSSTLTRHFNFKVEGKAEIGIPWNAGKLREKLLLEEKRLQKDQKMLKEKIRKQNIKKEVIERKLNNAKKASSGIQKKVLELKSEIKKMEQELKKLEIRLKKELDKITTRVKKALEKYLSKIGKKIGKVAIGKFIQKAATVVLTKFIPFVNIVSLIVDVINLLMLSRERYGETRHLTLDEYLFEWAEEDAELILGPSKYRRLLKRQWGE